MQFKTGVLAAACILVTSSAAFAQRPVALVEDVSDGVQGVESLDYVTEGQTIQLDSGKKLVLGYLGSCRRETITGGFIKIGVNQSVVEGGQVTAETIKCDRGALRLASAQAGQSGAAAIRVAPPSIPGVAPNPELTIQSQTPVIKLAGPSQVKFERIDQSGGQPLVINVSGKTLDLASTASKLEAGGLYRVTVADGRSLVVKVADGVGSGTGPVAGRLIVL